MPSRRRTGLRRWRLHRVPKARQSRTRGSRVQAQLDQTSGNPSGPPILLTPAICPSCSTWPRPPSSSLVASQLIVLILIVASTKGLVKLRLFWRKRVWLGIRNGIRRAERMLMH